MELFPVARTPFTSYGKNSAKDVEAVKQYRSSSTGRFIKAEYISFWQTVLGRFEITICISQNVTIDRDQTDYWRRGGQTYLKPTLTSSSYLQAKKKKENNNFDNLKQAKEIQ